MTNGSTTQAPDLQQIMRENRWLFMVEGIIFLIVGFLSIMLPFIASGVLAIFIGWFGLVIGILLVVRGISVPNTEDQGAALISGVLFGILGLLILFWPLAGLEGLTLFMAAFCIVRGVMDLVGKPSRSSTNAGLQVISGIAGILLGILLLIWYPNDAEWAPGLLFGIQLLFLGFATLAVWNALDHPSVGSMLHEESKTG